MKTYIIRGLKAIAQGVAYGYSGLLIAYFILRIIFWDRFWIVALLGGLIPWLLFPVLLLPFLGFLLVKQRWFSLSSSSASLILIGWLHSHYFSPDLSNQH